MKKIYTLLAAITITMSFAIANPVIGQQHKLENHTTLTEQRSSVVSPNPVKDVANITFYSQQQGIHQLDIFDIIGNKVKTYTNDGESNFAIDMTDVSAGMYFYFIMVDDEEPISTGRIIVRR